MISSVYWPLWNSSELSDVERRDYARVDRTFLAFGHFDREGGLDVDKAAVQRMTASLRSANPAMQIVLSLGGWGDSERIRLVMQDPTKVAANAVAIAALLHDMGIDGVDLDWEFPEDAVDGTLIKGWVTAVRAAAPHAIVTAAVSSNPARFPRGIANCFDSIHVMTYDFSGPWSEWTAHGSDFATGRDAIKSWIASGVPASKLAFGCAAYGRTCRVPDRTPGMQGVGAPALTSTWEELTYDQVAELKKDRAYVRNWDSGKAAPWLWSNSKREVVLYEDENVVRTKRAWALARGLQGIFLWCARQDTSGKIITALTS